MRRNSFVSSNRKRPTPLLHQWPSKVEHCLIATDFARFWLRHTSSSIRSSGLITSFSDRIGKFLTKRAREDQYGTNPISKLPTATPETEITGHGQSCLLRLIAASLPLPNQSLPYLPSH